MERETVFGKVIEYTGDTPPRAPFPPEQIASEIPSAEVPPVGDTVVRHKVPMEIAAEVLSRICDEIDAADHIDAFLAEAFDDASLSLSEAVDRRIAFDRWVKIQIAANEEGYRLYREQKETLQAVHERFKARVKAAMEATPDIPFSGKLGKISLCKNSAASIEYAFGAKDEMTLGSAEFFGVPRTYLIAKTVYMIDHARVKRELEAGGELPWATMTRGNHVRFPQRKTKQIEGKDS